MINGSWGNVICESGQAVSYWEVIIHSHAGAGHVRVGIANPNFDLEIEYPGFNTNSIGIYPKNVVQGFGAHAPQNNSNEWNTNDKIGVLFDKKNAVVNFYQNQNFITTVKNIPNPETWRPIFCVHCSFDKISLVENPILPQYDVTL